MNKCNILIPTHPNNELGDIQNIGILPYKAKTKLIIVKKIEICKYIFQPLISEFESEKEYWEYKFMINSNCLIQGFEKYQIQILYNHNKDKPPAEVYDKQTLKLNLIEFLRTKGDTGAKCLRNKAILQILKHSRSIKQLTLRNLTTIKSFAKTTKKASKLIYLLPSTLQN